MFAGANLFRRLAREEAEHRQQSNEVDIYADDAPPPKSFVQLLSEFLERTFKSDSDAIKRPRDYYVNADYHPNLSIFTKIYLRTFARLGYFILNEIVYFNNMVTLTICIAGITVGAQTYDALDSSTFLAGLDTAILAIFTTEVILKIWMEGLRPMRYKNSQIITNCELRNIEINTAIFCYIDRYFYGPEWKWNNFDFLIVLFSFPFWSAIFSGGSSIALLRLVRLSRLGKLIKRIPALRTILQGLAGGLTSISYIMVLTMLIYYLYAVVGFYLFSVNDPFHFGNVPMAMVTLYRVATLDNWGDLLYVNKYGCDVYNDNGVFVMPPNFTPRNRLWWCANPSPSPYLSVAYFVTFVIIGGMILASLFIGAVTLSMTESMEQLSQQMEEQKKSEALKRNKKRMMESTKMSGTDTQSLPGVSSKTFSGSPSSKDNEKDKEIEDQQTVSTAEDENDDDSDDEEEEEVNYAERYEHISTLAQRFPVLWLYAWYLRYRIYAEQRASEEYNNVLAAAIRVALGETAAQAAEREAKEGTTPGYWLQKYLVLAKACSWLATNAHFNNFMTFVILTASLNVGAQTDDRLMRQAIWVSALDVLDRVILSLFTFEVVIKMIGEGRYPLRYFNDNWNRFDFLIVVGSYVPGAGSTVTILRLMRLLRILKLVKRLPQLNIIVSALVNSATSIGYVALVLAMFFYVFAIVGVILFKTTDPWHFGALHRAILSLFRIATLDNSTEIQYINMFGCERYNNFGDYWQYPHQCVDTSRNPYLASIYFLAVTVLGAQVLLSLFMGVVSTSMDKARQKRADDDALDIRLDKTAADYFLSPERVLAFRTVFELLDLDQGGTIEEDELKIGLSAVNAGIDDAEIAHILRQVDPNGEGVDVEGFVRFMFRTSLLKDEFNNIQISKAFKQPEKKAKKAKTLPWYQFIIDIVQYGGTAERIKMERFEAAFVIQDAWDTHKTKKEAKRVLEEKKKILLQKENDGEETNH